MVNDPVGDMIIQIKNAGMAGKRTVTMPYSKEKESIGRILESQGYIENIETTGVRPKVQLHITLRYRNGTHAVDGVKRISKPGVRRYVGKQSIPPVMGNIGIAIISTSKGIMTGSQAKKLGIGGELLCEVW